MEYTIMEYKLSLNYLNNKLKIYFNEEVFKEDYVTSLDNNNIKLKINEGKCSIQSYSIRTDDNINFEILFNLDYASDGKQSLFLDGILYNSKGNSINFKNEKINLNVEYPLFTSDTILKTDQGNIKIEDIHNSKYTINNKKILDVKKSIDPNIDKLILIKKDSLDINKPNSDILLKKNQKIFYKDKFLLLYELFLKFRGSSNFSIVNYKYKYLYSFELEDTKELTLNNLRIDISNKNDLLVSED